MKPEILQVPKKETAHMPPPETPEEMEARLKLELQVCNKIRALYKGKDGCPSCHGKGTLGVNQLRGPDYRLHLQVLACYCSEYGKSDVALLIERMEDDKREMMEYTGKLYQVVYGKTFFGFIEVKWFAVTRFVKKVWNGMRSSWKYLVYGDPVESVNTDATGETGDVPAPGNGEKEVEE